VFSSEIVNARGSVFRPVVEGEIWGCLSCEPRAGRACCCGQAGCPLAVPDEGVGETGAESQLCC